MKLTAATAMPTPKRTPASTRFEPPSPNANVSPETTMATRESPRAIVLVNACCNTPTAFSQGELPVVCAKAGAARRKPDKDADKSRAERTTVRAVSQRVFIYLPRRKDVHHKWVRGKFKRPSVAGRGRNANGRMARDAYHRKTKPVWLSPRDSLLATARTFPLSTHSVSPGENVSQRE